MASPVKSIKFFCRVPETFNGKPIRMSCTVDPLEFKLGVGPCGLFVYDLQCLTYNSDTVVILQKADNRHLRGTGGEVPLVDEHKEFIYKLSDVHGRITKVLN